MQSVCAFGVAGAAVTTEPGWIAGAEYHDLQRLQDLNEIAAAVMQFKSRHATLPYDASISQFAAGRPSAAVRRSRYAQAL